LIALVRGSGRSRCAMSAGAASRRGVAGRSATRCAVDVTSRSGCERSSRRCHS